MRKPGAGRTCLRCGKELPADCSISRRFCVECGKERNREMTRARQQKAQERANAEEAARKEKEDRAYCKPCEYYGTNDYVNNLCDYLLRTGHARGCKAGVGCRRKAPLNNR